MIIPDLNILLYAVDRSSVHHRKASAWLEEILNKEEKEVGLPWAVYLGFIRLTTSRRLFNTPLTVEQAISWLDALLNQPTTFLLNPGKSHRSILRHLLLLSGTAGNLVSDAHLAALALEFDATIVTGDRDFLRFPGLKVHLLF